MTVCRTGGTNFVYGYSKATIDDMIGLFTVVIDPTTGAVAATGINGESFIVEPGTYTLVPDAPGLECVPFIPLECDHEDHAALECPMGNLIDSTGGKPEWNAASVNWDHFGDQGGASFFEEDWTGPGIDGIQQTLGGPIDWSRMDQVCALATSQGKSIFFKLRAGNDTWTHASSPIAGASNRPQSIPPDNPAAVAEWHSFVAAAINRYAGNSCVAGWAIENENDAQINFWAGTQFAGPDNVYDHIVNTFNDPGVAAALAASGTFKTGPGPSSRAWVYACAKHLIDTGRGLEAVTFVNCALFKRTEPSNYTSDAAGVAALDSWLTSGTRPDDILAVQVEVDLATNGHIDIAQIHYYEAIDCIAHLRECIEDVWFPNTPYMIAESGTIDMASHPSGLNPEHWSMWTVLRYARWQKPRVDALGNLRCPESVIQLPVRASDPHNRTGTIDLNGFVRPEGHVEIEIATAHSGANPRTCCIITPQGPATVYISDGVTPYAIIDTSGPVGSEDWSAFEAKPIGDINEFLCDLEDGVNVGVEIEQYVSPDAFDDSPTLTEEDCYHESRVLGYLWSDGAYNTAFNLPWFIRFQDQNNGTNARADLMEACLVQLGLDYTRDPATDNGNTFQAFRLDYPAWDDTLFTTELQAIECVGVNPDAFVASVIEGEGSQAGQIADDFLANSPNAVQHIAAMASLLTFMGYTPIVNAAGTIVSIPPSDWPMLQGVPFVLCGRVPGGTANCILGQPF